MLCNLDLNKAGLKITVFKLPSRSITSESFGAGTQAPVFFKSSSGYSNGQWVRTAEVEEKAWICFASP